MKIEIRQNIILYLFFMLIAFIGMIYGRSILNDYTFVRVWAPQNFLVLLLGIPFLFFQSRAGLPDFLSSTVTPLKRFGIPIALGTVFGMLDVLVIKVILHPQPYNELPPFLQPFPYSLFLYFSGAFDIEVFYRLIPITLILLLGTWFKKGKYYSAFFTAGAILTALREPLEQLPDGSLWLIVYSLGSGFLMNYLQAIYLKKAGFLASLTLRLGHYLVWHILLGIYVEFIELAG